ncbi:MAG: hypothetical protein RJA22_1384 [Verrucomicrobiota bacterium]|jgi:hypothetical protein
MVLRLISPCVVLVSCWLLASAQAQTPAPASPAADPEVLRLLRQTIAEQTRNPDRIIRNLEKELAATNLPPRGGRATRTSREAPAPTASPASPVSATNATPSSSGELGKKGPGTTSTPGPVIRANDIPQLPPATNSPTAAAKPPTKRERLDALLKQVVQGTLSDEDYKKQRDRILAEPE